MLQSMNPDALASLAAIIGLVGRAAWPLLSTRVGVLRGQLLIGVAFTAHYALLGIPTAAIVNVLGSLQTATALFPLHARTARYAGCGLIVAMAATTIATWAGSACLLVVLGQAFIVIVRMQKDVVLMFMLLLVGQLLWGVHDMVIGSPWASAADVVGLLVGGWMLARHCSNIPIALSGESSAIGAVEARELTYTNQVLHRLYANLQQRPRAFPRSWRTHLSLASQSI